MNPKRNSPTKMRLRIGRESWWDYSGVTCLLASPSSTGEVGGERRRDGRRQVTAEPVQVQCQPVQAGVEADWPCQYGRRARG